MPTFPGTRARGQLPAAHAQSGRTGGTTHIAVRVQQGFSPPAEPEFGPTDECLAAIDRLLEQFKGRPRLQGLICALADRGQPIKNALEDTKNFRSLDTATGTQLDRLGELYKETRAGKTDDQYRAFLKALALIVASRGRSNEHLDALVFLDNGFAPSAISLVPHYPAGFIMTAEVPFPQVDLGFEFARVLRKIPPSGVKFMLMFEYPDTTSHFVWSGDTGSGFAEVSSPGSTGGVWAEAV